MNLHADVMQIFFAQYNMLIHIHENTGIVYRPAVYLIKHHVSKHDQKPVSKGKKCTTVCSYIIQRTKGKDSCIPYL